MPLSLWETSRSIRGTIRWRSKPSRLARIVAPVPAPPAMYANAFEGIDFFARFSSLVASVGTFGRMPLTPAR